MNDKDLRILVLLAMQTALLGEITPEIRGITCSWNMSLIEIHGIFDGEVNEDHIETIETIASEVISHLPEHEIETRCLRVDFPKSLDPYNLGQWVYRRKE